MSYSFEFRTYFSIQHIQSAAFFTGMSGNIENVYKGQLDKLTSEVRTQHNAYVTNAIFSSVCFLEATVNELFCDVHDGSYNERLKDLGNNTINLMKNLWKFEIPKTASYTILEKFQIALTLANKELFNTGSSPYQDIFQLIR